MKEVKDRLQFLEKGIREASSNLKKFKVELKKLHDDVNLKNYTKTSDLFCKNIKVGTTYLENVVSFFRNYVMGVSLKRYGYTPEESLEKSMHWLDNVPDVSGLTKHTWTSPVLSESKMSKFESMVLDVFMNEDKNFDAGIEAAKKKFDQVYAKIVKDIDQITGYFDKVKNLSGLFEKGDLDAMFDFTEIFKNGKTVRIRPDAPMKLKDVFYIDRDIAFAIQAYCNLINIFNNSEHKDIDKKKWFRRQQMIFKYLDGYLKGYELH